MYTQNKNKWHQLIAPKSKITCRKNETLESVVQVSSFFSNFFFCISFFLYPNLLRTFMFNFFLSMHARVPFFLDPSFTYSFLSVSVSVSVPLPSPGGASILWETDYLVPPIQRKKQDNRDRAQCIFKKYSSPEKNAHFGLMILNLFLSNGICPQKVEYELFRSFFSNLTFAVKTYKHLY